ncbi:hypothetical protein KJ632_01090 [Patescibacteria group bacterium]|nr:hypothetical protein [Patescibacteria group bacterium]
MPPSPETKDIRTELEKFSFLGKDAIEAILSDTPEGQQEALETMRECYRKMFEDIDS